MYGDYLRLRITQVSFLALTVHDSIALHDTPAPTGCINFTRDRAHIRLGKCYTFPAVSYFDDFHFHRAKLQFPSLLLSITSVQIRSLFLSLSFSFSSLNRAFNEALSEHYRNVTTFSRVSDVTRGQFEAISITTIGLDPANLRRERLG